ncbi:hypothetical protein B835_891 [Enterococcus mundtii 3F]|nr:hypothetical protein [Enterococcus mundtii 3F]
MKEFHREAIEAGIRFDQFFFVLDGFWKIKLCTKKIRLRE